MSAGNGYGSKTNKGDGIELNTLERLYHFTRIDLTEQRMKIIVNLLCLAQLVFIGQEMARHGFPSINDNDFWIALVIMIVPLAVFFERILGRNLPAESKSLIGLEIEARKAKLRREIDELNSQNKN
jgi:hypothetical protein